MAGTLRDPSLAARIGSIVEAVGPDGSIQIEDGETTETTWEYLDGVRWASGYVSPHLLRKGETMARLCDPRILLTDQHLERPEQMRASPGGVRGGRRAQPAGDGARDPRCRRRR